MQYHNDPTKPSKNIDEVRSERGHSFTGYEWLFATRSTRCVMSYHGSLNGNNAHDMELDYGATYYAVTYADPQESMPRLEPMVYVGENLFGEDTERTHYFQDTVSVIVSGIGGGTDEKAECLIYHFLHDQLGESLVDIDGATALVVNAAKKFKLLGCPKLEKAEGRGRWISE